MSNFRAEIHLCVFKTMWRFSCTKRTKPNPTRKKNERRSVSSCLLSDDWRFLISFSTLSTLLCDECSTPIDEPFKMWMFMRYRLVCFRFLGCALSLFDTFSYSRFSSLQLLLSHLIVIVKIHFEYGTFLIKHKYDNYWSGKFVEEA